MLSRTRSRQDSVGTSLLKNKAAQESTESLPNPNILMRALEAVRASPSALPSRSRDRSAHAVGPVADSLLAVKSPLIEKRVTESIPRSKSSRVKGRLASRLDRVANSSSKPRPLSKYSGSIASAPGSKVKSIFSSPHPSPIKKESKQRNLGTPSSDVKMVSGRLSKSKSKSSAENSGSKPNSKLGAGSMTISAAGRSSRRPNQMYGGLAGEEQRDAEKYSRRDMGATLEKAKQDWMDRASIMLTTPVAYPVFQTDTRITSKPAVPFEDRHIGQGQQIAEDQRHSRKIMSSAMDKANQDWQQRQEKGDTNITVPRGPSLRGSASLSRSRAAIKEAPSTLHSFVASVGLDEEAILNLASIGVSSLEELDEFCLGGSATVELGLLGLTEIEAAHLIKKCRERAVFSLPQQGGKTDITTSNKPNMQLSFASEQRLRARSLERGQSEPRALKLDTISDMAEDGYHAPTWNSTTGRFERNAQDEAEAKRLAAEVIAERESRWIEPMVEQVKLETAMRIKMADEGNIAKCEWESRRENNELQTIAERPVFATEKRYPIVNVAWVDRHIEQGQEIRRLEEHGRKIMGSAGAEATKGWVTRQQGNLLNTIATGPDFESEKKYPFKAVSHADQHVSQSRRIQLNELHGRHISSAAGTKAKIAWETRNVIGALATLAEDSTFESEKKYPIAHISHADRHLGQGEQIQYDQLHGRKMMASEANAAKDAWTAREQGDQLLTFGERPHFESEKNVSIPHIAYEDRYVEQGHQIERNQYHGRVRMAMEAAKAREQWEDRQKKKQLHTIGTRPNFESEKKYPIAQVAFENRFIGQEQQIRHDEDYGRSNMASANASAKGSWRARNEGKTLKTIASSPTFATEQLLEHRSELAGKSTFLIEVSAAKSDEMERSLMQGPTRGIKQGWFTRIPGGTAI